MKCDRVQRLISEGYERRLTLEERLEIREHVQTCAACATFERNLRTGLEAIHRMPDITPSRKLWESVHTLTATQPRPTPKRIAYQALGIAGAALTVALVAVVTIVLINHNGGTTPPSTMTARQGFGPQSSAAAAPSASSALSTLDGRITPEAAPDTARTPETNPSPASNETPEPAATPPGIIYVSPTPVALDHQTAEDTVVGYFHAINLKDYAQAYDYLGTALQQTQTYESFAAGFSETAHDTVTITDISPSGANQLAVTLHLDAEQIDRTTRKYDGTWFVGIEGNVPKIVSASVTEEADEAATPTPVPNNLCRSTQVKATASYTAMDNSITGSIIITYGGVRSTCVLEGTPQIEIVDANGNVLKTAQVALNPGIVPKPLVLENNQQAELRFIWSNWCAAASNSSTPKAAGDDLWFRITLAPGDKPITLQPTDDTGESLTATPQCIDGQKDSTISVQGFARYPDS
ncbi:MAG TPA: zf-HC2 domain-containing protein [Nitrolancea sp.]|nr:zf-HC2 domain-containing protein [Nitrolancea sp.]